MQVPLIYFDFKAAILPLTDCSEVERLGQTLPEFKGSGYYYIDPTGQRNVAHMTKVYCHLGWTYVLRREQGPGVEQVRKILLVAIYL